MLDLWRTRLRIALLRWCGSEEGATAIEYALISASIALTIIVAVAGAGGGNNALYLSGVMQKIVDAIGGSTGG